MKKKITRIMWYCHIDLWNGSIYSEILRSIFFGDDCTFLQFSLLIFVCLAFWLIWKLVRMQD